MYVQLKESHHLDGLYLFGQLSKILFNHMPLDLILII